MRIISRMWSNCQENRWKSIFFCCLKKRRWRVSIKWRSEIYLWEEISERERINSVWRCCIFESLESSARRYRAHIRGGCIPDRILHTKPNYFCHLILSSTTSFDEILSNQSTTLHRTATNRAASKCSNEYVISFELKFTLIYENQPPTLLNRIQSQLYLVGNWTETNDSIAPFDASIDFKNCLILS